MARRSGIHEGISYEWLDSEVKGRFSNCDRCHRKVFPDQSRLRYHDGKGKIRSGSKHQASTYMCVPCALELGIVPPVPEHIGIQEEMFDG